MGSLMWLTNQTRPDIYNAGRAVSRYCASLRLIHCRVALGMLECVRRTSTVGITLRIGSLHGLHLQAFTDAKYASKAAGRRSVRGGG